MSRSFDTKRPLLTAKGLRFGLVVSRFNNPITDRLVAGARRVLARNGAKKVDLLSVPGAFEIPLALQSLAKQGGYDALIALGAVIRGETPHFEYVANAAATGTMEVMLRERIPVAFGVLTTNNTRQALDRSGSKRGNKGEEAALVAIEMARKVKNGKPT